MAAPSGFIQPYSTGASYVYIGFPVGSAGLTAACLGTCEGYPKHERRPDYMQLMNDVSGRRKPIDMSFQGQDATISLNMTVWDEGVAQMLQQFADLSGTRGGAALPGRWRFNDVGSLMGFERGAVHCWILYGNRNGAFAKAAYNQLPFGYHYPQCIPFGTDTTEEGAQPLIRNIQLYAWPICNFQTQTFTLYDGDMTGLPAPVGPVAA